MRIMPSKAGSDGAAAITSASEPSAARTVKPCLLSKTIAQPKVWLKAYLRTSMRSGKTPIAPGGSAIGSPVTPIGW